MSTNQPIINIARTIVIAMCACVIPQTTFGQSRHAEAPVHIIDGVVISPDSIYGVLQTLDPATIKAVNVVHDSVAGRIFHMPPAGGVVLITTKKQPPRPKPRGIVCYSSLPPGFDCPLYIVDGVAIPDDSTMADFSRGRDPLHRVDPKTITSVEILKDPDARAMYGSRGESGVVVVTTKKR
jgi:TonB-dependent SusC/RagA subfamily outer membrane receptor